MMILIGIILIFLGIGAYAVNDEREISNDRLCMLGFLLIMTGGLMIGEWIQWMVQCSFNFKLR